MQERIIAVDTDMENCERQKVVWAKHGVNVICVSNVREAIVLVKRENFLAVGINADCIDYEPLLPVLRSSTDSPIHVIATQYSAKADIRAINLGANVFSTWCEDFEIGTLRDLAQIHRYFDNLNNIQYQTTIIGCEDIRIYPDYHKVLVCGNEINLRKKEFEILQYMIVNKGRLLRYEQILNFVWGDGYENSSHKLVWDVVSELNRKLKKHLKVEKYIVCVKGMGYRFDVPDNMI